MSLTVAHSPYVRVDLEPFEWEEAMCVGIKRVARNRGRSNAGHYERTHITTDYTANCAGAVAERAVAKATNRYWTAGGAWAQAEHADYRVLPDVSDGIEVRRIKDLNNQWFAVDEITSASTLFACYCEPPDYTTVRILGWATHEHALAHAAKHIPTVNRLFAPLTILTLQGLNGVVVEPLRAVA